MTVAELITLLQDENPNAEVYILDDILTVREYNEIFDTQICRIRVQTTLGSTKVRLYGRGKQ